MDEPTPAIAATAGRRPTSKSAETRARIVAGALKALVRNGIEATTTRRIADEASIRLATLHYHFASKEAVLLAVLEQLIDELTATLFVESTGDTPLPDRIDRLVRGAWTYAEATRDKQVVQYELTLHALRSKGSAWLARRQYAAYVDAYRAQLERPGGDAVDQAGAVALARFILAGIDGLILQRLTGASNGDAMAGVEALVRAARGEAQRLEAAHQPVIADPDPAPSQKLVD
jgi:AcrR family transcriptional regulator